MNQVANEIALGILKAIPWWLWVIIIIFAILGPEENIRRRRHSYKTKGILEIFVDWIWYQLAEKKKIEKSGINNIDRMSGYQFEKYLINLFIRLGYKVRHVGSNYYQHHGDFGADLIVEKDGVKTAVRAKNYNNLVGIEAVRRVLGAINYYQCQRGIVVTNNFFSFDARTQASVSNVELWDRNNLIDVISKLNTNK